MRSSSRVQVGVLRPANAPRSRAARSCRASTCRCSRTGRRSARTPAAAPARCPAGRSCVSVRQARPGRPLTTMPQLPQMPARQTKSNASDGSSFSRISFSAMNSVMPAASSISNTSKCGMLSGSCGSWRSTWKCSMRFGASTGGVAAGGAGASVTVLIAGVSRRCVRCGPAGRRAAGGRKASARPAPHAGPRRSVDSRSRATSAARCGVSG